MSDFKRGLEKGGFFHPFWPIIVIFLMFIGSYPYFGLKKCGLGAAEGKTVIFLEGKQKIGLKIG